MPVVALVPRPSRWPQLRQRLDHEVQKGVREPLTEEALAFAFLYQHSTTLARARLYDAVRANGCACQRCQQRRAYGDAQVRGAGRT
jgi:hypothetical protein